MVHPATHCVKLSAKSSGQQIHKPLENKQQLKKSTMDHHVNVVLFYTENISDFC